VVLALGWYRIYAKQRGNFFLDVDDRLSLSETSLEMGILLAKDVNLSQKRVGLWTRELGGESGEGAFGAKLTPLGDLGGVDALATQESTTLRRAGGVGIVLLDQTKALGGRADGTSGGGLYLGTACDLRGSAILGLFG
jgi:hypothetical protein